MGDKLVRFKKRTSEDMELDELLRSLSRTQREIDLAYNHFNFTSDPDLIESCVYEISSLQCRYNYLLRRVKERGGSAVIRQYPERYLAVDVPPEALADVDTPEALRAIRDNL